ncbi:hypothetical protein CEXT_751681 [Caerostris extrusa]|uniref:Uncharacterized protein n=1 Tax=Caerostris extrusa TaxID=172846 RepID=A0AAV4NMU3_CAEEX|nr:hypothetical protein CEXT_751681 [Caerostris extrusa]
MSDSSIRTSIYRLTYYNSEGSRGQSTPPGRLHQIVNLNETSTHLSNLHTDFLGQISDNEHQISHAQSLREDNLIWLPNWLSNWFSSLLFTSPPLPPAATRHWLNDIEKGVGVRGVLNGQRWFYGRKNIIGERGCVGGWRCVSRGEQKRLAFQLIRLQNRLPSSLPAPPLVFENESLGEFSQIRNFGVIRIVDNGHQCTVCSDEEMIVICAQRSPRDSGLASLEYMLLLDTSNPLNGMCCMKMADIVIHQQLDIGSYAISLWITHLVAIPGKHAVEKQGVKLCYNTECSRRWCRLYK